MTRTKDLKGIGFRSVDTEVDLHIGNLWSMKKRNSIDQSHERKRQVMVSETNLIAVPRRSECRSYSSMQRHSTIRHLLSVRAISLLSAWWAVWLTMIIVLVVTLVYVRNQKRVARHCTSHRWRWFAHVHIEEKEDCRHRNTLLMVHFFSFLFFSSPPSARRSYLLYFTFVEGHHVENKSSSSTEETNVKKTSRLGCKPSRLSLSSNWPIGYTCIFQSSIGDLSQHRLSDDEAVSTAGSSESETSPIVGFRVDENKPTNRVI